MDPKTSQNTASPTGAPDIKGSGAAAQPAGEAGLSSKVKGAYHVVHGLGENIRGTTLGAIDTATHQQGPSENEEIARKGKEEMERGMAAFKGPGTSSGGHTGQTGSAGAAQTGQTDSGAETTAPGGQRIETQATSGQQGGTSGFNDAKQTYGDQSQGVGHQGPQHGMEGAVGAGGVSASGKGDSAYGPQTGQGAGFQGPGDRLEPQRFVQGDTNGNSGGGARTSETQSGSSQSGQTGYGGGAAEGPPAYHHRDDAITSLGGHSEGQHGVAQNSADADRIPTHDRNEGFSGQQGPRGGDPKGEPEEISGGGNQGSNGNPQQGSSAQGPSNQINLAGAY